MKEFIESIKSANLVEAKKKFAEIMEGRIDALRQEMSVQIAEEIKTDSEEEKESDDENDDKNKKGKDPDDTEKED